MRTLLLLSVILLSAAELRAEDFAAEKKADRLIITRDGKPLAHYIFGDPQIPRPYFAHVHSLSGVQVTRRHPPVEGTDPVDHAMMHPGIWLAFSDVSGHDFWRNKAAIRHERFTQEPAMKHGALTFATVSKLVPAEGAALAEMSSVFTFSASTNGWLLAWDATFTPLGDGFYFGDQEEMGLGVRMATALSETKGGIITSSTGKKGAKETWGQIADWCDYAGEVDGRKCGILLMASPENFRPSWFHNRDYGLMVANPFGKKAFTKEGEPGRVAVEKGKTLRLRYGVLVHDEYEFGPDMGIPEEWRRYLADSTRDDVVAGARQVIASLHRGKSVDGSPHAGALDRWRLLLDTYNNRVPSSTIADLYSEACRKLKELYGDEVKTYSWNDEILWPRIATIVVLKNRLGETRSTLVVWAFPNNDNDSFGFTHSVEAFDTAKKKLLPSWELPKDYLKEDSK